MATATLIIEDGTASSYSANSYITVAEANQFCANHGLSDWENFDNSDKITAIIRACAFVDAEYHFKGAKYSYDSPMQWPRVGVYDEINLEPEDEEYYQEIPRALKNACCRAAYEEAMSPGVLQANETTNVKREKIDVIETEYFEKGSSKTIYRTIEGFIKDLITNANGSSQGFANILRT